MIRQFKPKEPLHCGFAHSGRVLKHFVPFGPLVLADPDRRRTYVRYARTFAYTACFKEQGHGKYGRLHQFDKTVIGNGFRELVLKVLLYIIEVKVLHVAKTVVMEQGRHGDDFTLR